jgi:hypothetical protein
MSELEIHIDRLGDLAPPGNAPAMAQARQREAAMTVAACIATIVIGAWLIANVAAFLLLLWQSNRGRQS